MSLMQLILDASGYPGPGILPGGRTFYISVGAKF
jgi:hypothetical protein